MKNKLLIWDFDGVIADTEKIWLQNRMDLLNLKYNANWNFETTNSHLGGMSDKTKSEVLKEIGIDTDKTFWEDALKRDMQKLALGVELTKDVEDVFNIPNLKQCIATGGTASKTKAKIEALEIRNYFPEELVFTADMVEYGKPEPDLFLLSAEVMGCKPENCLVIEDSIAGLAAAVRAKMTPVAFIGHLLGDKAYYLKKIKEMGIVHIFENMKDVRQFVANWL